MSTANLRERAIDGVLWSGIGQVGSFGLRYVVFLILAWKLSPAAIGLESLTSVLVLLMREIGILGFGAALIRQERQSDEMLNTAFWGTLVSSILVSCVVFLRAGDLALLLGDLRTERLLMAMCLIFPIRALWIVPSSVLSKKLDFQTLTGIQFLEHLSYGIVAIPMAFFGAGVWSLVFGRIVMTLVRALLLWGKISWRPSLSFHFSIFQDLLRFGSYSLTSNILTRGLVRVDYFLVGKFIGTTALGFYTLASQLAIIPPQRLVGAVQRVVFPTFSLVQNELKRLKAGFLETCENLIAVLLPFNILVLTLSPLLIRLLYGEKWLPAVPLMQVLSFISLMALFDINKSIFYAQDTPGKWTFIITARMVLFVGLTLGFGVTYQLLGVSLSYVLSFLITTVVSLIMVNGIIQLRAQEILPRLWIPIKGGLISLIPYLIYLFLPSQTVPIGARLAALGMSMLGLYGLVVYSRYSETLHSFSTSLLSFLRERLRDIVR